ncbi:hypothetical protein ACHMW6_36080 [Pseudoduganella sp. UC29_106]|uniref:hypothetical protein n=1 Tax=Pseudoduganella sp. UC29_106 TaxID=3374553 RepID=UPI0037572DA8
MSDIKNAGSRGQSFVLPEQIIAGLNQVVWKPIVRQRTQNQHCRLAESGKLFFY